VLIKKGASADESLKHFLINTLSKVRIGGERGEWGGRVLLGLPQPSTGALTAARSSRLPSKAPVLIKREEASVTVFNQAFNE